MRPVLANILLVFLVSAPEEDDSRKRKESKGLIGKKDKKKQKEKETRYAHLADDSSGEDEIEGK